VAEDTRSQKQNKELAMERFYEMLQEALKKPKKRKKTKPPKSADEERLKEKKEQGEKKQWRKDSRKFY
jgi:ribosome-associated protein